MTLVLVAVGKNIKSVAERIYRKYMTEFKDYKDILNIYNDRFIKLKEFL